MAADAAHLRFDHEGGEGAGDGGIDRVAAPADGVEGDLRRLLMPGRDRTLGAAYGDATQDDGAGAHQQEAAAVAQAGPVPARSVPSWSTVMALTRPKAFRPGDSTCATTLWPIAARPSRTEAGTRVSI